MLRYESELEVKMGGVDLHRLSWEIRDFSDSSPNCIRILKRGEQMEFRKQFAGEETVGIYDQKMKQFRLKTREDELIQSQQVFMNVMEIFKSYFQELDLQKKQLVQSVKMIFNMNMMHEIFMFYLYGHLNEGIEKNFSDNIKILNNPNYTSVSEINSSDPKNEMGFASAINLSQKNNFLSEQENFVKPPYKKDLEISSNHFFDHIQLNSEINFQQLIPERKIYSRQE